MSEFKWYRRLLGGTWYRVYYKGRAGWISSKEFSYCPAVIQVEVYK